MMRVYAYERVSTREQGDSGLGLEAQDRTIKMTVAARDDWELVETFVDVASGKSTDRRPNLAWALDQLKAGKADALVVAKLDRLSRSVIDFAQLLERARDEGWAIIALDVQVDTSTATGEMVVNVLMAIAQWERRMIGERTKAALAAKRAQGAVLGRPKAEISDQVKYRVWKHRDEGLSLRKIVDALNAEGVEPPGRSWNVSAVKRIVDSREAEDSKGEE